MHKDGQMKHLIRMSVSNHSRVEIDLLLSNLN